MIAAARSMALCCGHSGSSCRTSVIAWTSRIHRRDAEYPEILQRLYKRSAYSASLRIALVIEAGFRLNPGEELFKRDRSFIALLARANRHSASLGFFCADDEHIRHLLKLRVSD